MSLAIEVFRSDDYLPDGEVPLLPVLVAVFRDVIGPSTRGVTFDLYFYQLMDMTTDLGKPSLVNLRASHGYLRVRIWRDGELLYRHPHPIRELIGEPLRALLRTRDPDVGHWGYGVRGPGLESIPLRRPAPQVTHELRVESGARRRPRFIVEEVPEPELPRTSLAELGADVEPVRTGPLQIMRRRREPDAGAAEAIVEAVAEVPAAGALAAESGDEPGTTETAGRAARETASTAEAVGQEATEADALAPLAPRPAERAGKTPPVVVAVPAALVSALVGSVPFSDEIEEGGFLAGRVFRDAERADGYLVHVTAVIPAQRTGASMLNFTFTGESFLRVGEQLAARGAGETLLGWYHTHLFAATPRSGLSSVDVELHRSTFRRPWQVAALLNISDEGRVLRFYHGEGTDEQMTKVPYWTVPS